MQPDIFRPSQAGSNAEGAQQGRNADTKAEKSTIADEARPANSVTA